jgi:hypothetical protein
MLKDNWSPRMPCATCKHNLCDHKAEPCASCKYNERAILLASGRFKIVDQG